MKNESMMFYSLSLLLVLANWNSVHSQSVPFDQVTPTTEMSPTAAWPIEEISDGITSDDGPDFNGFVSDDDMGIISLDLAKLYDLESFIIFNDVNVFSEGIMDFRLEFFDCASLQIETSFDPTYLAPFNQLSGQEYVFPKTVSGVVDGG